MHDFSVPSLSHSLSLQETLSRLQASSHVDGIAEFGSRAANHNDAASDYDLLILVRDIPARVFQMVTTIDGRVADLVLVETEAADALLATQELPAPKSLEGLFAHKMKTARVLYDVSGRLARVQEHVNSGARQEKERPASNEAELYSAWFWQSFGLVHLERMAESQNPVHLTAVDMMLTALLSVTWRSYFEIRDIVWEGEKAAVRYWSEHEPAYLELVSQCVGEKERRVRLAAYRELVKRTLAPIGTIFVQGETAVILADSTNPTKQVPRVLEYWNGLIGA